MQDKIQIANILLTRRCNLKCSYCNLVRNYDNMPEEYCKMANYANNELTGEQWIEIFDRLVKNNPNVFFVIYGGEPFLYEDLYKIIKHCNENNIYYTIISNNTDFVQDKIKEVYDKCGQYRGFTSSVDPIIGDINLDKENNSISTKSNLGLHRLIEMKNNGMADDVVAELTVMKSTIPYLYNTVKQLSNNGIYSSITTLDDNKNEYYDFARILDVNEMVTKDSGIKEQFDMIKSDKDLLIHMPELLDDIFNALPSNATCNLANNITNVTIDADGTFRLCLRIRGVYSPKLSVDNIIDSDGIISWEFKRCVKDDLNSFCEGCNWSCIMMSESHCDDIIDHGSQNN